MCEPQELKAGSAVRTNHLLVSSQDTRTHAQQGGGRVFASQQAIARETVKTGRLEVRKYLAIQSGIDPDHGFFNEHREERRIRRDTRAEKQVLGPGRRHNGEKRWCRRRKQE
jgi:hypothetical protein